MTDSNEPRYGRRAEDEPGYARPAEGAAGGPAAQPQYGSSPQPPYQGGAQTGPAGSSPYSNPVQPGYQQPAPAAGGPAVTPGNLPGRGLAITLIVLGIITMLIIAPIVTFTVSAASIAHNLADGGELSATIATPVFNGDTVTVDQTGMFTAGGATDVGQDVTCKLVSESGDSVPLQREDSLGSASFTAVDVPPGDYAFECNGLDDTTALLPISGEAVSSAAGSFVPGLIAGTVVGLIGLLMLVFGIIRLVKVNKKRREIMLSMRGW